MNAVARQKSRTVEDAARTETRRWLSTWKRVGSVLEAERWQRLQALTDTERARTALDLLGLWRRDLPGDDGEALLRVQRAFALWRRQRV